MEESSHSSSTKNEESSDINENRERKEEINDQASTSSRNSCTENNSIAKRRNYRSRRIVDSSDDDENIAKNLENANKNEITVNLNKQDEISKENGPVQKHEPVKDNQVEESILTQGIDEESNGSCNENNSISKRRNIPSRRLAESSDEDLVQNESQSNVHQPVAAGAENTNEDNENLPEIPENEPPAEAMSASDESSSLSSSSSDDSYSDFSFDSPLSPLLRFGLGIRRNIHLHSDTPDSNDDEEIREKVEKTTTEIMSKKTPLHNQFSWPSILANREKGFYCKMNEARYLNHRKNFERSFYGSLNAVERLELMSKLNEHFGCVNCLGFSKNGLYLLSGSDDLRVILWNWYNEKPLVMANSKHKKNIFQTKFYDESDIVMKAISASADGTISIHQFLGDGGHTEKQIYTHAGAVHKVAVSDVNNVIYTCGEDGLIIEFDYRTKHPTKLTTVREKHRKISLFSITAHPYECKYAVTGKDQFVRVYDKRNQKIVLSKHCPEDLVKGNTTSRYISCCVYNYNGTELLASFNDESIYLFDANDHNIGSYLHKYQGHVNSQTIKGVNFYGPKSEYIVTGSDCGNVFFYEKKSESIVQYMKGDECGIVNVLEPHPIYPVLATSGLDKDIKIWMPSNDSFTLDREDLKKCVNENITKNYQSDMNPSFSVDPHIFELARRFFQRHRDPSLSPNNLPFVYRSDTSDSD